MRVALVAGEASGDSLGAGLIAALRRRAPGIEIEAVAGPAMRAAGCEVLAPAETLAVMGLTEVLRHLPRLLALRRRLLARWRARPPDAYVGIDAPDFNLGIEGRLHRAGVRTVHYVSPTVWAWRRRRVAGIARAVDCMLTLFPFEADFYHAAGVPVRCVGHPLQMQLQPVADPGPARGALGLPAGRPVVALLPGSRANEWRRLAPLFVETACWLHARRPQCVFVVPLAGPAARAVVASALAAAPEVECMLVEGRAQTVMAAADVVLAASGTATLEAMLLTRPMVVAYRLAPLTYALARRLVRVPHVALPNLLAGRALVPELLQDAATPAALGAAVLALLEPARAAALRAELLALRPPLPPEDPSDAAARAVLAVAGGLPA